MGWDKDRHDSKTRDHPNIEAYTALLNGYAKAGKLNEAFVTLKNMKSINVFPNEHTYTCLISALVKERRVEDATKFLEMMEASNAKPTTITYNSYLSALQQVG